MKCEIPELGRCCFCFPLRLGLLVWGYAKLVATVMLMTSILIDLIDNWERFFKTVDTTFAVLYMIFIISMAADTIFLIIFAISAHKKDHKIMDWFSKFSIFMFVVYTLCLCLSIAYFMCNSHFLGFYVGLAIGTISFCCLISQIYIIILVRSEVLKLKRGTNFEFINHGSDTTVNVKLDSNEDVAE